VTSDEKYMQLAIRLARLGIGNVEPNPAVGAVIVKDERIIGKGWHKKFGGAHAEIEALDDCCKRGNNPAGATMYVTLEPCCHYGKTGPCTDALIAAKLKRVVIATIDPSRHAHGRGIKQLKRAGMKVDVGECAGEARVVNAAFMKFASTGKPWVTVKWAQTIDGKLTYKNGINRWISCEQSRKDVHELRRRVGAILVGINSIVKDDSLLTPRPSKGRKPLRIVLNNRLRIPLDCRLLSTAKDFPVLIVARARIIKTKAKKAEQITHMGAELLGFPQKAKSNLRFLLGELGKRGIQRLLVEGGPTVIGSFLEENLADEIIVYIAPKIPGARGDADIAKATKNLNTDIELNCVDIKRFGNDVRISGFTKKAVEQIAIKGERTGK